MVGDEPPSICPDLHHGTQQPGSSSPCPKSNTFSGDSNRGDTLAYGGLCLDLVVLDVNAYAD